MKLFNRRIVIRIIKDTYNTDQANKIFYPDTHREEYEAKLRELRSHEFGKNKRY